MKLDSKYKSVWKIEIMAALEPVPTLHGQGLLALSSMK